MHWDSLLVADFGHGLITPTVAQRIAEQAKWLGLTVQSNAANWGFNLLTKWPRADYVVLDEMELRLACTDRDGPLDKLMAAQMERLGATKFVVTLGHRGCVIYDGDSWHQAPALIPKPVDRMGAGDAFLAWSAPMAEIGAPSDVVALVGNIAGGVEAGMVGNQPVTRQMVLEWMQKLFTIG
jgi:sugar/nucleoside kinase (ribokinase family)